MYVSASLPLVFFLEADLAAIPVATGSGISADVPSGSRVQLQRRLSRLWRRHSELDPKALCFFSLMIADSRSVASCCAGKFARSYCKLLLLLLLLRHNQSKVRPMSFFQICLYTCANQWDSQSYRTTWKYVMHPQIEGHLVFRPHVFLVDSPVHHEASLWLEALACWVVN